MAEQQKRTPAYFLVKRAQLNEEKQKLLSAIEKITRRNRAQRERIIDIKASIIAQARQTESKEDQIEKKLYQVMKIKSELERHAKVGIEEVFEQRRRHSDSIAKELQKNAELQSIRNRQSEGNRKQQSDAEIKARVQLARLG